MVKIIQKTYKKQKVWKFLNYQITEIDKSVPPTENMIRSYAASYFNYFENGLA